MVNWSSPDIEEWRKEATEIQQDLFEKLGDRTWDYFKEDQRWAVERKVAFALFGEPTVMPIDKNHFGYSKEQMIEICRICDLIYEQSGSSEVYLAFLFVIGKIYDKKYCIPIFRVRVSAKAVYLDSLGRTYKDWYDFKNNNKLPKSLVCYPLDGTYISGSYNQVLLEFSLSPSCALGPKVCNVLDSASSIIGLGATAIGIAGLVVTVAAPLAIASSVGIAGSGIYGLFRGSQQLYDRQTHNQTISPADSDARNNWLSVLGGVFGIGSAVAMSRTASIAASGGLLGSTSRLIVNFFNFGSLSVNGLGIINGLAYLVERSKKNELTTLDIVQWTASVFFFYNAVINIKTANGIVRDVQEGIKNEFTSDLSKRRAKAFNRVMKETTAEAGTMEGNAKLIKGISNIGSKDDFFRLVIKGQKKFDRGIKFNQEGYMVTKGKMFFDTKAGVNYPINYKVGGNFFKLPGENVKYISRMCTETFKLMERVNLENQKNTIVIDENIKFELKTPLLTRLSHVLFRYCDSTQDDGRKRGEISAMIFQAEKFAQDMGCSTETIFVNYFEFICIYKKSKLQKMKRRYQEEKSRLMSLLGKNFDEATFNMGWGVQDTVSIEEAFQEQINQEINESNSSLKIEYDKYNADVEILNESGNVKFHTTSEALIQFYRCFVIDLHEKLALEEFFDTIRRTVQDENFRMQLTDDDNMHTIYYDKTVPVVVEVQETDCGVFFETISFQELLEPSEDN